MAYRKEMPYRQGMAGFSKYQFRVGSFDRDPTAFAPDRYRSDLVAQEPLTRFLVTHPEAGFVSDSSRLDRDSVSVEAISQKLDFIKAQLDDISFTFAEDRPGLEHSSDELKILTQIIDQSDVNALERLSDSNAISLNDGLDVALMSLRRAGEDAERAVLEAGHQRRHLDDNARRIDAVQKSSRAMIEDLLVAG